MNALWVKTFRSLSSYWIYSYLLVGAGIGLLIPKVCSTVVKWGEYIPSNDLTLDYALGLFVASLFYIVLFLLPVPYKTKKALFYLWSAKCAVALFVMPYAEWIFTGGDVVFYYGSPIRDWHQVTYGDGTSVIRYLSFLVQESFSYLFLPCSYHAQKICFSFVGLMGIFLFYRASVRILRNEDISILYLLGFFPSLLYWSCFPGKEPIILIGYGMFSLGLAGWTRKQNLADLGTMSLGLYIACSIRIWSAVIMIAPAIVSGLTSRNLKIRIFTLAMGGITFIIALSLCLQRFAISSMEEFYSNSNQMAHNFSSGGSKIEAPKIHGAEDILIHLPLGIFTAILRPLPGEVNNLFGILAGIEDLGILVFLCYALRHYFKTRHRNRHRAWLISFIFIWAAVYGTLTFGNLGTLVRYRLQISPLMIILLLELSQFRWNWNKSEN